MGGYRCTCGTSISMNAYCSKNSYAIPSVSQCGGSPPKVAVWAGPLVSIELEQSQLIEKTHQEP